MRGSLVAVLGLLAATVLPASAQQLPRLSIASFTFASDTTAPRQEQLFHLIIDVRLNGHVTDLESVVLPQLDTLEIAGDEKHTVAHGTTTEYREVIGVVWHRGGTISIPPAYLDAIDERDGRPKKFLSNPLTLQVAGPASALVPRGVGDGPVLAGGFIIGAVLIVALAWLALTLRKIPAPPSEESPEARDVPPTEALPPASPPDAAERARIALSNDPSRDGALAARTLLWSSIGAGDGETLADVVRRPAAHDPALRAVLRAIERAAFTNDADRADAIEDALRALDGYHA